MDVPKANNDPHPDFGQVSTLGSVAVFENKATI